MTYRCIFDTLRLSTLQCNTTALVLKTLRSDETLDLGSFGVRFLSFAFGLNFATDDEFADLEAQPNVSVMLPPTYPIIAGRTKHTSSSLVKPKNLRIFVALFGPNLFGSTRSVNPGMSPSPFLTTLSANTLRSIATIHPLTLFLLRSPVRRGR